MRRKLVTHNLLCGSFPHKPKLGERDFCPTNSPEAQPRLPIKNAYWNFTRRHWKIPTTCMLHTRKLARISQTIAVMWRASQFITDYKRTTFLAASTQLRKQPRWLSGTLCAKGAGFRGTHSGPPSHLSCYDAERAPIEGNSGSQSNKTGNFLPKIAEMKAGWLTKYINRFLRRTTKNIDRETRIAGNLNG